MVRVSGTLELGLSPCGPVVTTETVTPPLFFFFTYGTDDVLPRKKEKVSHNETGNSRGE